MAAQSQRLSSPSDLPAPGSLPPLLFAGRGLAADLLSTLLFVAVFALTKNVYAATGVGIASGVLQIGYLKLRGRPIAAMQWLSLFLVMVFGVASLLTNDPRFVMAKPSLIYTAVGLVMLRPGWMVRYMPPGVMDWSADVTTVFGYVWAGLMFLTAGLNLLIAATVDFATWAAFVGLFPLASKLILFAVQYLTTRWITMRRRAAAETAASSHMIKAAKS